MNTIVLSGMVYTEPEFSHEKGGMGFYTFYIASARTSGFVDKLPCVASEKVMKDIHIGEEITVTGEIRSRNSTGADGKSHLLVRVHVKKIDEYIGYDTNVVTLIGYIGKTPTFRVTPNGRHISDILIASNRPKFNSDYIPSIAWGRNAKRIANMNMGACLYITGRFQSRVYTKTINESKIERVSYEVSIKTAEIDDKKEEI